MRPLISLFPPRSALLASLVLAAASVLPSTLSANDAVDALNGKIQANYGEVNDTYSRGIAGSLSIPVAQSWGIQFDTLYQHAAEDDFYGLGAHFFTRRSETGLLGLVVAGVHSSAIDNVAVAFEGEYYTKWVTVGGLLGYDNVQSDINVSFAPRVNTQDDFLLANLYLAAYPIDNLMVRFDYTNRLNRNFYDFQVEYQTPVKGLAAFGIIGFGDGDFFQLLGGMRYYIGKDKTLKARHRQDDPINVLNSIQGVNQAAGQNPVKPVPQGKPLGPPPPRP